MAARYVSPPLLNGNWAVDIAIVGGTAPSHHPLSRLLLVLFREIPKVVDLTLDSERQKFVAKAMGGSNGPWSAYGQPLRDILLGLGKNTVALKRMVRGRSGHG